MGIVSAILRLAGILALSAGIAAAQTAPEGMAGSLDGRFLGIGAAEGAAIEIAPDEAGYAGRFEDAGGRSQAFEAEATAQGARTVLDLDSGPAILEITPLPFGLEAVVIPVGADGTIDPAASRVLAFRRDGLEMPAPPENFTPAPRGPDPAAVTGNGFVASYAFWSPTGVRDGYLSLTDRHRRMIRLFSAVQLDVIWKLCLAPSADRALAIALRGEPVDCARVVEGIAAAQRTGRFDAYKAEVRAAAETLRLSIRCADNYVTPPGECARVSGEVAAAATSLETTATVLGRYR
jgi:hypothetical protein